MPETSLFSSCMKQLLLPLLHTISERSNPKCYALAPKFPLCTYQKIKNPPASSVILRTPRLFFQLADCCLSFLVGISFLFLFVCQEPAPSLASHPTSFNLLFFSFFFLFLRRPASIAEFNASNIKPNRFRSVRSRSTDSFSF